MNEVSPDSFVAFIPEVPGGTEIFYYLNATSNDGREVSKPLTAPAGFYHFKVDESVPVELLSFIADEGEDGIVLRWITGTETNNKGFEIQRSEDGDQKSEWKSIGYVEGKGTTTESYNYSFKDKNITIGKYKYRLKQIDFDGSYKYSNEIEIDVTAPIKFSLEQNYPNPFNPMTNIEYQIANTGLVKLVVYNSLGEEVATLVNEYKSAGSYEVKLDASNLPSGVYIYRLTSGSYSAVKKLVLLK